LSLSRGHQKRNAHFWELKTTCFVHWVGHHYANAPYRLIGTLIPHEDETPPQAILQNIRGKQTQTLTIGDKLNTDTALIDIQPKQGTLEKTGEQRTLTLNPIPLINRREAQLCLILTKHISSTAPNSATPKRSTRSLSDTTAMSTTTFSILRNVKNTETAKDLTQETWLKAYRAIDTFRGDSTFTSWLYRIAENVCIY